MKKDNAIRDLLGVSQEDLALLLNVTRSQLAMYESGKRDLPVAVKVKLASMLKLLHDSASQKAAPEPHVKKQEQLSENWIKEWVTINKIRQMALERKIKRIEKKYASNLTILKLMTQLEQQKDKNTNPDRELLKIIKTKAMVDLEKNGLHVQTHHYIIRATLQEEAKLLEIFLQKHK